jgi:hypothetical protein
MADEKKKESTTTTTTSTVVVDNSFGKRLAFWGVLFILAMGFLLYVPQPIDKAISYFRSFDSQVEAEKKQGPPPLIYQGTNTFTTTDWSEEIVGFNGLKFKGTTMTSNLWYDVMFDRDTNQIYHCYPRELDPAAVARFTNPFTSIQFKVTPGHDQKTGKIIWVMRP